MAGEFSTRILQSIQAAEEVEGNALRASGHQLPSPSHPPGFGHIPGIRLGQCFDSRKALSQALVHPPVTKIVHIKEGMNKREPPTAASVVLNGRLFQTGPILSDGFSLRGCGGWDRKTNVPIMNMTWNPENRALRAACDHAYPVRVTRFLDGMYFYQGLFKVTDYQITQEGNFRVFWFEMKGVPDEFLLTSGEVSYHTSQKSKKRKSMLDNLGLRKKGNLHQ